MVRLMAVAGDVAEGELRGEAATRDASLAAAGPGLQHKGGGGRGEAEKVWRADTSQQGTAQYAAARREAFHSFLARLLG